MKNVLKYLLLALIAVSQLFACGGSDDSNAASGSDSGSKAASALSP